MSPSFFDCSCELLFIELYLYLGYGLEEKTFGNLQFTSWLRILKVECNFKYKTVQFSYFIDAASET